MINKLIIQTIHSELKRLSDKERASHSQKYFKTGTGGYGEGDLFIGVKVPYLRQLSRKYKRISILEASKLLQSKYHEERLLALFILVGLYQRGDEIQKNEIYALYMQNTAFINNWDLVDSSAGYIVGAHLYNSDKKILYKLAKSNNIWERRIAIMATSFFIKNHDYSDTLKLSKILLKDEHELIHKAVGWMLREIGNRDFEIENAFLKKHYHAMPRTMLRYSIEKFPEKTRQSYLKGLI